MLSHYKGISLFVDNDFIFKCNPSEIEQYLRNKPVACVKHKLENIHGNKMDGVENKSYPRKCWSSLMLFDNELIAREIATFPIPIITGTPI